jgi:SAM-dependent methyltransferase
MVGISSPTLFRMDPELYLRVREKEGRLYSDDVVARLPFISDDHPLAGEWRVRSASAQRLVGYLSSLQKPRFILDLGCGNGWLSNLLTESGHRVIGLDQNLYELKQAARVFRSNPKLSFLESDIFSAPFVTGLFDVIILASVLQYFSDASSLISMLSSYLRPQGEIHILDTPLYSANELEEAKLRSNQYYTSLGFPEMCAHYFHHHISYLDALHPKKVYTPRPLILRLKRWVGQVDSPFLWVVIGKQN